MAQFWPENYLSCSAPSRKILWPPFFLHERMIYDITLARNQIFFFSVAIFARSDLWHTVNNLQTKWLVNVA